MGNEMSAARVETAIKMLEALPDSAQQEVVEHCETTSPKLLMTARGTRSSPQVSRNWQAPLGEQKSKSLGEMRHRLISISYEVRDASLFLGKLSVARRLNQAKREKGLSTMVGEPFSPVIHV
jgi:hypothetical protein